MLKAHYHLRDKCAYVNVLICHSRKYKQAMGAFICPYGRLIN